MIIVKNIQLLIMEQNDTVSLTETSALWIEILCKICTYNN